MSDLNVQKMAVRRVRAVCLPRGQCSVYLRHRFRGYRCIVPSTVHQVFRKYCVDYTESRLQCYALDNGGLYLAPTGQREMHLAMGPGRFSGVVPVNVAAIVACAQAFGHLGHEVHELLFAGAYLQLREYIMAHPDRALIERIQA